MASQHLKNVLTHDFLKSITTFWFRHLDSSHIIVPSMQDATIWFTHTPDFDKECITNSSSILETIRTSQPSSTDIIAAANPSTPLHWISLIILLDQLPRNCYRGTSEAFAFDNLALEIALRAIELRVPREPPVRFRLTYVFWIYMPLEHAEDLSMQDWLEREHDEMFADSERLMAANEVTGDADIELCRNVLGERRREYGEFRNAIRAAGEEHRSVVRRFGRFPRRNEALGRVSSDEEVEYLQQQGS